MNIKLHFCFLTKNKRLQATKIMTMWKGEKGLWQTHVKKPQVKVSQSGVKLVECNIKQPPVNDHQNVKIWWLLEGTGCLEDNYLLTVLWLKKLSLVLWMGDCGHKWRDGKVNMLQVKVDFCQVKKILTKKKSNLTCNRNKQPVQHHAG